MIPAATQHSTSRLLYHVCVKGAVGMQVIVQELDSLPRGDAPVLHPLVPLHSLAPVKEKQQIGVSDHFELEAAKPKRDPCIEFLTYTPHKKQKEAAKHIFSSTKGIQF